MLVLTRKIGEGIVIGEDITVRILEIKGNTIRIGIDAPRDYRIYRQEVHEQISRENREAAQWQLDDLDELTPPTSKEK